MAASLFPPLASPPPTAASETRAIPAKYKSLFTEAQAEELVAQFQQSDADGSGSIDEREFQALLTRLSLDVTPEEVSELVASIDSDGNGLVDFEELVEMVVKIKQGDTKFSKFRAFLETLDTTPVALLEREAVKFQLQVEYQLLEERVATKATPALFTMGLTLRGKWIKGDQGRGELVLQAVGKTTRDAKFQVAHDALVRVKQLQPGLACEPGDVPSHWRQWLLENLDAGASPSKVMKKLREKGFSPAQNLRLMQQISTRVSSLRLRQRKQRAAHGRDKMKKGSKSAFPIYDEVVAESLHGYERDEDDGEALTSRSHRILPAEKMRCNGLHPVWVHWSQQELERGIDGHVVLDELVALGFEPERFPFVAQSFIKASYLDGNQSDESHALPVPPLTPRSRKQQQQRRVHMERSARSDAAQPSLPPRPYCFSTCLQDGHLREVELFVHGGQELNVPLLVAAGQLDATPLQLVSKAGHVELVRFLLAHGAVVDLRDASHRTPLLLAAREGHTEICRLLISSGADLLAVDALGNTPLHCAAFSGCAGAVDLVLEAYNERLLVFLADLPRQRTTCLSQILKAAHTEIMHSKLRANERRKFHVTWCWDALLWVYKTLFGDGGEGAMSPHRIVPFPKFASMDHLLTRYHARFLEQRKVELLDKDDDSEEEDSEGDETADWDAGVRQRKAAQRAARREWIGVDEMAFCVDLYLRESFKNAMNLQGRTALHVACDENLVCTHELVIQRLVETHGCDPELKDHSGNTPLDLLLTSKGRPGSPRGDVSAEKEILVARRLRIEVLDAERERQRLEGKRCKWHEAVETMARDFHDLETLERAKQTVTASSSTTRVASLLEWDLYEEPLSRNRLFINTRSGFVQRRVPPKVAAFSRERLAWKEKLALHAHFVEQNRELPEWEVHRVNGSDVYFFFNRVTTECRWLPPDEPPVRTWRTARIFREPSHLADCEDHNALALVFSGTFSTPLRNDCVRGRVFGHGWRECSVFGIVFYWNESDDSVMVEKPEQAVEGEAQRYGHVRIRSRSEEIDDFLGGWRRWYDARSAQSFYYDDASGECVLDVDADRAFLRRIRKPRARKIHDAQLTPEERAKRLEEHEWKQTLERARKREVDKIVRQEHAQEDAAKRVSEEREHAEALRVLEASVTSEHYDEADARSLAYIDARFQREKTVFLQATRLDSMPSVNPRSVRAYHETERAIERSNELESQERSHAAIEDNSPNDKRLAVGERRRVSRLLWKALERVRLDFVVCKYGCGLWFPRVQSLAIHEMRECPRRRMVCRLGCGAIKEDRVWQREIRDHESPTLNLCSARVVYCPRDCGVFTPHDTLSLHMTELCVRRPIGDLKCRLGCGVVYTGGAHELLALEQQRVAHEQDECLLRKVLCTWPQCRAVILAQDRNAHRRTHVVASGVCSFVTAEIHEYKVPKGIKQLKLQAWGGGGGSGLLKGQTSGHGGGGAFVEGVCQVFPGETLYFAVGAGGYGGRCATMKQNEIGSIETHVGAASGGAPGGGVGHAGNTETACGGGGGFTSVYRHSAFGIEYLLIAAGGGGGGTCRHGGGGGSLTAPPVAQGDDLRVGRVGDANGGGKAGECDALNPVCRFVGHDGASLQGGDGAEFGGGGGGGFFGGGGGGFAPGIVGGGGGGSSFVNAAAFQRKSVCVVAGGAVEPGGMDRRPPRSARTAYWDLVDGVVGEGGTGDCDRVARGNHGGVRIARPGFFKDMHHHG